MCVSLLLLASPLGALERLRTAGDLSTKLFSAPVFVRQYTVWFTQRQQSRRGSGASRADWHNSGLRQNPGFAAGLFFAMKNQSCCVQGRGQSFGRLPSCA